MELFPFEASNGRNWGKFAVGRMDDEWQWRSQVDTTTSVPLLRILGWGTAHIWVMDLQTGEGAIFRHGGYAKADLDSHKIWVCPLFEPFLAWLYEQDVSDLSALPALVELPDAEFQMQGYRRPGKDV